MKLFVDENIPNCTVEELRGLGHDVLWTRVLNEQRLLITTDKGFAQHRHETHHGLLIVRLRQPNEATIHERVMRDTIQSVSRAGLN
jgi:predicted nuclease of predicted toxin-antitoxin system